MNSSELLRLQTMSCRRTPCVSDPICAPPVIGSNRCELPSVIRLGEMGPQGPIGWTGTTGTMGSTGSIGVTGFTGASGPIGSTGVTGPLGTGPTGTRGFGGPAGPVGATGRMGSTGAFGPSGLTGPTGTMGSNGNTGSTGPLGMGLTGLMGLTGPTGPSGDMGSTGQTGPLGTGLTGPTGTVGPTGSSLSTLPGTTYRDLTTFSFTNNNGIAGLVVPITNNVLLFYQPIALQIAYIAIVYSTTGQDPGTTTLSLHDMTGIPYTDVVNGPLIGPVAIFTMTPGTTTTPLTQEINTSSLTPAGPYTTAVNRSIAIRLNTTNADRFVILSLCIGFSSA